MQDWVRRETEFTNMGDARLNKRLAEVIDRLSIQPNESIPSANDCWTETVGVYRLIDNNKSSFDSIMSGHRAATLNRAQEEPVVLIPQDTTFLNFATEAKKKDMGTLRVKDSNQQLLHTSIAITPSRVNLGVVDGSLWQRSKEYTEDSGKSTPDKKESERWMSHYRSACEYQSQLPNSLVVSIADREGDIHEWFQFAEEMPGESQASYIVRAKANRAIELPCGERRLLWDYMSGIKPEGSYELSVPKRNGEPEREAVIDVRYSEVQLVGRGKNKRPLFLYVVYAKERGLSKKDGGIEWMLHTNLPVDDFTKARTMVEWYRSRWEIETYFRVLKGRCHIEDNRFQNEVRMFNAIAIYMIISWRLHSITMLARRNPESSCALGFSEIEWKTIWRVRKKSKPPKTPPSMYEMTRMLACMGGFLARKGDGEPGVKNIWRGYNKLLTYIEAAELLSL